MEPIPAMTIPPAREGLERGFDLFNRSHFFDAHEVLEDVWRPLPRDRPSRRRFRLHVQGMIQLAVAFHHLSTGNRVGARSVLARAMRNLHGADSSFPDLDFDRLRAELEVWRQYLDDSEAELDGRHNIRHDGRNVARKAARKVARTIRRQPAPALPKILPRR